ncbi:hypothetical protein [Mycolicibacterium sp.]|uniref:hypothetical protein n=1 Tax=Mycolicibacterium sp. TaxID=2320850 RepID=UPI003D14CDE4
MRSDIETDSTTSGLQQQFDTDITGEHRESAAVPRISTTPLVSPLATHTDLSLDADGRNVAGETPERAVATRSQAGPATDLVLDVPGDGWCMLYSVALSLPSDVWPQDVAGLAERDAVIAELIDRPAGRPLSAAAQNWFTEVAAALHQRVIDWVGQHTVPGEVVAVYRTREQHSGDRSDPISQLTDDELLELLRSQGIQTLPEEAAGLVPVSLVRDLYIEARVGELSRQPGHSTESARATAVAEVPAIQGDDDVVLGERAPGVATMVRYLNTDGRGGVSLHYLDRSDLRVLARQQPQQQQQPLTDGERRQLLTLLNEWQAGTDRWAVGMGEMFPSLLAYSLGIQLHAHALAGHRGDPHHSHIPGPAHAPTVAIVGRRDHYSALVPSPDRQPAEQHHTTLVPTPSATTTTAMPLPISGELAPLPTFSSPSTSSGDRLGSSDVDTDPDVPKATEHAAPQDRDTFYRPLNITAPEDDGGRSAARDRQDADDDPYRWPRTDSGVDSVRGWIGDVDHDGQRDRSGRWVNCGPATVVVFNRLSGVAANMRAEVATLTQEDLGQATGLQFVEFSGGEIAALLRAQGSGAHSVVVGRFDDGRRHAFNVVVDGDRVYAVDAGRSSVEDWPPALDGREVQQWFLGVPAGDPRLAVAPPGSQSVPVGASYGAPGDGQILDDPVTDGGLDDLGDGDSVPGSPGQSSVVPAVHHTDGAQPWGDVEQSSLTDSDAHDVVDPDPEPVDAVDNAALQGHDPHRLPVGSGTPETPRAVAYRLLAPQLQDVVTRRDVREVDLNRAGHLTEFRREASGELSSAAVDAHMNAATSRFDEHVRDIMRDGGIVVEGIGHDELLTHVLQNRRVLADFPELETFLLRPDRQEDDDGNRNLTWSEETYHGVQVRYQSSASDPTAADRMQQVQRAILALHERGFVLPPGITVFLPRYARHLTVRADWSSGQLELVVTPRRLDSTFGTGSVASYGSDRLIITSQAGATQPPSVSPFAISDRLHDPVLGLLLHEMMHLLHARSQPRLYADLSGTVLLDEYTSAVASVSSYALEGPVEFVAEYGVGLVLGRPYDADADVLEELYTVLGGPRPVREGRVPAPALTDAAKRGILAYVRALAGDSNLSDATILDAERDLGGWDRWTTLVHRAELIAASFEASTSTSTEHILPQYRGRLGADSASSSSIDSGHLVGQRIPTRDDAASGWEPDWHSRWETDSYDGDDELSESEGDDSSDHSSGFPGLRRGVDGGPVNLGAESPVVSNVPTPDPVQSDDLVVAGDAVVARRASATLEAAPRISPEPQRSSIGSPVERTAEQLPDLDDLDAPGLQTRLDVGRAAAVEDVDLDAGASKRILDDQRDALRPEVWAQMGVGVGDRGGDPRVDGGRLVGGRVSGSDGSVVGLEGRPSDTVDRLVGGGVDADFSIVEERIDVRPMFRTGVDGVRVYSRSVGGFDASRAREDGARLAAVALTGDGGSAPRRRAWGFGGVRRGQDVGGDVGIDLEAQRRSIARFPRSLPGMAEVSAMRVVDTEAIAALVNRRRFGPAAARQGRLASRVSEVVNEYTAADVSAFMRAAGLSDQDIARVWWTSFKSGLPYPAASLLGNLLQYVAVPGIGVLAGATASAWSSAAFVLVQILSSAALQPIVITASEQIAKRNGPFIEVDKTKINYQVSLEQATEQVNAASDQYAATLQEFHQHSALRDVGGERAALRELAARVLADELALHEKLEQLFAVRGGQERQWRGAAWQVVGRTVRSPASTALGFLTGSSQQASGVISGGRRQKVSPQKMVGVQAGLNIGLQVFGHLLAGVDEYNKVMFKTQMNIMYGDLLNDLGHQQWRDGRPVTAAGIDASKVHQLFSAPPVAVAKVVSKLVQPDIDAMRENPDTAQEAAELARQVQLATSGQFHLLDREGRVAIEMIRAAGLFPLLLLLNEAITKYNWGELQAQLVQRFNQAFHMGVAGSAVATVLPRAVSAGYGGTARVPSQLIGGLIALSAVLAFIGAITQYKSQTQKNYNKEMETSDSLAKQIWKGVGAAPYLFIENIGADAAAERAAGLLNRRSASDAEAVRDALDEPHPAGGTDNRDDDAAGLMDDTDGPAQAVVASAGVAAERSDSGVDDTDGRAGLIREEGRVSAAPAVVASVVVAAERSDSGVERFDGRIVPVRGDGLCLLNAVVMSVAHNDADAAVVNQVWGNAGGGEVMFRRNQDRSAMRRASVALQDRVRVWVEDTGRVLLPADVVQAFRQSDEQLTALNNFVATASDAQLRARLRGGDAIQSPDWAPDLVSQRYALLLSRPVDPSAPRDVPQDPSPSLQQQFDYLAEHNELPAIADLGTEELRNAVREIDHRRELDETEFQTLIQAVRNWATVDEGWNSRYGETFPVLVTHALGIQLRIWARNREPLDFGPATAPLVEVYYDGLQHYDAVSRPGRDPRATRHHSSGT